MTPHSLKLRTAVQMWTVVPVVAEGR